MNPLLDRTALEPALAGWVSRRGGRGPCEVELLATPPSGNSNLTLPFAVHWDEPGAPDEELVLRLQHPDNQIFLDADVLREHRILDALANEGSVPVARPRWSEPDPKVLGHPFYVMERVAGSVPAGMPSIHATGWLTERSADERAVAWDSTLVALAAVHRFEWRAHLPDLAHGANGTTIGQRLDHLTDWYRWVVAGREFPVTDAGLEHLRSTVGRLAPADPVLLWGDARMGNTMFGADGQVAALLDWELGSVGPAAVDLGWWLTFDEFSTGAHGVVPLVGYPDRATTIARYGELTGAVPPDLDWFEALAEWVITVTVIRMADIGVAAGRLAADTGMGHGNLTAQMLARRLGLPVPELDVDYAQRRGLAVAPGE